MDAVFGMGFDANQAPETALAAGNPLTSTANFESYKMRGADSVFGSSNVEPAVPVSDSPILATTD